MFNQEKKESMNNSELEIHTMRDDVKGNFSQVTVSAPPTIKKEEKKISPEVQILPKKQREDIFPNIKKPISKDSWNQEEKKVNLPKNPKKQDEKEIKTPHRGLGKVLVTAIVISILLLVAAGGYYFWMTRMGGSLTMSGIMSNNNEEGLSQEAAGMTNENQTEDVYIPDFSSDSLNYLSLDIENIDAVGIKALLAKKASNILEVAPIKPIKFQVTDNLNSPVDFSDFAEKAGINLSQTVFDQMGNDFYLYAYLDNGLVRWGLEVSIYDFNKLQEALSTQESSLPKQLSFLYPDVSQDIPSEVIFDSSKYNSQEIRYANFKAISGVSLDYTISKESVLFGTSKMTLRSVLDLANDETVQ